ncbi:DUF742 domain-containing protein [Amycolatopsis acididurans]|nr:DUF742 domain-containing protein [Amycolatopsis acididurans]
MSSTISGSDPDDPRGSNTGEDWRQFRARVDRDRRQRRGASPGDVEPEPSAGWHTGEYRMPDFNDRLLSGPGSELFGRGPDQGPPSGEFAAFSGMAPGPGPGPVSHPNHPSLPGIPPVPAPPEATPAETSGLVRPYFRTGGRTRPTYDLAIEALVSTSERGRVLDRVKVPEHRSICGLCLDTRSVAEVAAYLRLPLGVVRVLIGDVAGLGLVLVHTATVAVGDRPSIEFMERVLSGLRRI